MHFLPSVEKHALGARHGKICTWYQGRENLQLDNSAENMHFLPSAGKHALGTNSGKHNYATDAKHEKTYFWYQEWETHVFDCKTRKTRGRQDMQNK